MVCTIPKKLPVITTVINDHNCSDWNLVTVTMVYNNGWQQWVITMDDNNGYPSISIYIVSFLRLIVDYSIKPIDWYIWTLPHIKY